VLTALTLLVGMTRVPDMTCNVFGGTSKLTLCSLPSVRCHYGPHFTAAEFVVLLLNWDKLCILGFPLEIVHFLQIHFKTNALIYLSVWYQQLAEKMIGDQFLFMILECVFINPCCLQL